MDGKNILVEGKTTTCEYRRTTTLLQISVSLIKLFDRPGWRHYLSYNNQSNFLPKLRYGDRNLSSTLRRNGCCQIWFICSWSSRQIRCTGDWALRKAKELLGLCEYWRSISTGLCMLNLICLSIISCSPYLGLFKKQKCSLIHFRSCSARITAFSFSCSPDEICQE